MLPFSTQNLDVQLAVSNASGAATLVIRKGESLATLRPIKVIKQTDVKRQQTAVITDTATRNTVASAHQSGDRRGEAGRAERKAAA